MTCVNESQEFLSDPNETRADDDSMRHGGLKVVKGSIRRRAQSAHNFINGAPLNEIKTDDHGVVLDVTPHFLEFTGYNVDEMVGRKCNFLQGKQTDRNDVMELRSAIERKKPTSVVILNYCKNGAPFWNILTITPHFLSSDVVDFYTGQVINIPIPEQLRSRPRLCVDDALALLSVYATIPPSIDYLKPFDPIHVEVNDEIDRPSSPSVYKHQNYGKRFSDSSSSGEHHYFVAETGLPTAKGRFRMRAYRNDETGAEPLAMICGEIEGREDVIVRVHDQCVTSEVFGSLRCDCKEQLDFALEFIQAQEGMVLYLPQEGRGIGLANKVAAYAAQESGMDTVDANRVLGLPDDARTYESVKDILENLNIKSIRLLTNNPRKIKCLEELGIKVSERLECIVAPNSKYSMGYVSAKASRMGHMIDMSTLSSANFS